MKKGGGGGVEREGRMQGGREAHERYHSAVVAHPWLCDLELSHMTLNLLNDLDICHVPLNKVT